MLKPGTVALVHEVWQGRVWAARPMRVVQDTPDLVVLWFPRGTRWQAPTTPPGRGRAPTRAERLSTALLEEEWVFVESEWDVDNLQFWWPGRSHSVWISWLPDGTHWGWYVNVQRPFARTARGLETMDLVLDVIVDPDGSWRLKDEDELEVFAERGVLGAEEEGAIRAEAANAVERARRGEPPFDGSWLDWRPDPDWALPEMPAGWNERCR